MMDRSNPPMPRKKSSLERLRWFVDHDAVARNEPGLTHSFVASLATALDYAGYVIDPVWLMGASGFAFRIWVEARLLPNAMNGFDWQTILPEAVRRAGFNCVHVHRFGHEMDVEEERRATAHEGIVRSIERGMPAIVWDPSDPPMWGLITGYNDHTSTYNTMAFWAYEMPLPYTQLGRRDVNRLSVILLDKPNDGDRAAVIRRSLESAVVHSEGHEGDPFRDIQSGLLAFDRWAHLMEPGNLAGHELQFADYYSEMFFSFRCYARDYLAEVANGDGHLEAAAAAYASVADELRFVSSEFREKRCPPDGALKDIANSIRRAKSREERALSHISSYLEETNVA